MPRWPKWAAVAAKNDLKDDQEQQRQGRPNLVDLRIRAAGSDLDLNLPLGAEARVTANPEEQNWRRSSVVINITKIALAPTYRP